MILRVNGSSSAGNSYILTSNTGDHLLLEAGFKARKIVKSLDYDVKNVKGCICSHVHQDHSLDIQGLAKYGIIIGANQNVLERKSLDPMFCRTLEEGKTYSFGDFQVAPFDVKHDVPTLGFFIRHPECGTILFATDCAYLPYKFPNVNHFIIEANYSDKILDENILAGIEPYFRKKRLLDTHMSLENCISSIRSCGTSKTKTITLIHLSSLNSDPELFHKRLAQSFGIPTYIAKPGLSITLK